MDNNPRSEKTVIAAGDFLQERKYWLNKLSGEWVKTCFPYDFIKEKKEEREIPAAVEFKIPHPLCARLMEISKGSDAKLHMILTAALVLLLNKYTGSHDVIVGTTIDKQETEGDFINTVLPLRSQLWKKITFKELLLDLRCTMVEAIENQNYPMETLMNALNIEFTGDDDEFPLFETAILFENIHDRKYLQHIHPGMLFVFSRVDHRLSGYVEYNSLRYMETTTARIIHHFTLLLQQVLGNIDEVPGDILLLSGEEKEKLLYAFNDTRQAYPAGKTLQQLFEEQVEKTPRHIALQSGNQSTAPVEMTYRQLNEQANRLAHTLRAQGTKPGDTAAIALDCSMEMVLSVIAVLKAGGAYLPIDPVGTPIDRIRYMLEDTGVSLLVTLKKYSITWDQDPHRIRSLPRQRQQFPPKIIHLDLLAKEMDRQPTHNPEPLTKPIDPAYLIFTSGSTGKPKGVLVHHQGLVNYTCWAAGTYVGNGKMSFPFYMPMSFDLTVTSVFVPLLTGNTIIVYGDEYKELLIERILDDNQVDVIKLTPAHLKLIRTKKISHTRVKRLIVGGEELETTLARDIYENFNGKIEIYNEYGPTETVVGCICHQFDPVRDRGRTIPVGHPIANTEIYLLDTCRRPVPVGVAGEIFISGTGVAPGYVNRPEITAQRFIPNHMTPGSMSYRTGDLGKFLPEGNIEFLGRIDQQVNIHGFRIELGEIESPLNRYDKIKEAVVLVKEGKDHDKSLCAYWVPAEITSSPEDNHKLDLTGLREFLSLQLPYYMIPSLFVQVDKIPLTPSGKVDKKNLLKLQPTQLEENYEAPRNQVERKIAEVWSEVLDVEKIGINDNLFEMGGDSIKTIQIAARLRKHKINVEINEIFSKPTVKELAAVVEIQKEERVIEQGIVEGEVELTPAQRWLFEGKWQGNPHVNQAVMLYRKEGFQEEKVNRVFDKIVRHHDALRMVYEYDKNENRVIQRNRNIEGKLFDLEVITIEKPGGNNSTKDIQKASARIQEGIDLARGPLVKLGLLKTGTGDHLLIVIHHLVVDGVSWRILLEDFSTGYELAVREEEITFPDKTDSFKYWAQKLKEYAAGEEVLKELPYWEKLETAQIPRLPGDNQVEPGKNKLKHTETRSINLTEAETRKLLKEVHQAYNTEINDILLTALAAAMNRWEGLDKIAVTLEGHGREPIMDHVTISRTVGYYTANFPVLLDIGHAHTISQRIKTIKELLRKIPNKGIGYGILKYLTPAQNKKGVNFLLEPEISFNYLGQFGQELKSKEQKIEFSRLPTGATIDPELQRLFVLDITGIITANRLTVSFAFNRNEYQTNTIERLAQCYYSSLIEIIQHCSDKSESELTPSDLTKNDIGMDELKNIMEKVSDILI